jgi:hypothetical protein
MKLQGRGRNSDEGFLLPPHHHHHHHHHRLQETQQDPDYLLFDVEQVKLLWIATGDRRREQRGSPHLSLAVQKLEIEN